jgi:uncharacterized protein YoxC
MRELKKQNQAIYKIATSVELMAKDLQGLKSDVGEIRDKQNSLSSKMDQEIGRVKDRIETVDEKDGKRALKFLSSMGEKLAWLVIGAIAAYFLYAAFPFLK